MIMGQDHKEACRLLNWVSRKTTCWRLCCRGPVSLLLVLITLPLLLGLTIRIATNWWRYCGWGHWRIGLLWQSLENPPLNIVHCTNNIPAVAVLESVY